tara:strand:- start:87 stop:542 length:456 start_codon:yes stop_codon:yes gene_type:complete
MPNLPISGLPQATVLQGGEEFVTVQGGVTKKTTLEQIDNYLIPYQLTVSTGQTINLTGATYDRTSMIELSWSGATGIMTLNLPDATSLNNTNRVIRFISNNGFTTSTRARLTPTLGQTLDGSTDYYTINKAYEGIQVWSNGTQWFIIQKKA